MDDPEEFGRTATLTAGASLAMRMVELAARTEGNLDAYVIGLARYIREKAIPHNSVVMSRAGIAPDPKLR